MAFLSFKGGEIELTLTQPWEEDSRCFQSTAVNGGCFPQTSAGALTWAIFSSPVPYSVLQANRGWSRPGQLLSNDDP